MKQRTLIPLGAAGLVLMQLLVFIFGIDAILATPVAAAATALWTISAVLFLLAGLNAEPLDTDFRVIAGVGYILNAVGFVMIMVATEPWQSPTSIYPESVMMAAVAASGLLLLIGLDLVTNTGHIIPLEPR